MQRQSVRNLPVNKEPAGTRCITIEIPDDDEWERQLFSEAWRLALWMLWERDIDHWGKPVADRWKAALLTWNNNCCSPETSRIVDGQTEWSPDGIHFYKFPGAMEPPQFNDAPAWPSGTVPEGQTAECLAAANIGKIFQVDMERAYPLIVAGAIAFEVLLVLAAVFEAFLFLPAVLVEAAAVAATLSSMAAVDVATLKGDEIRDKIICDINCSIGVDGSYTDVSFQTFLDKITDVRYGVIFAFFIRSWFGEFGWVGTNRMGRAAGIVDWDCSDCCPECILYDFSIDNQGFARIVPDSPFGTYIDGGWNSEFLDNGFGQTYEQLRIKKSYTGHISKITVVYSADQTATMYISYDGDEPDSGPIADGPISISIGDIQTHVSDVDIDVTDHIRIDLSHDVDAAPAGLTILSVEVCT